MKLKNTLRHIMGEDLITHLGLILRLGTAVRADSFPLARKCKRLILFGWGFCFLVTQIFEREMDLTEAFLRIDTEPRG